MRLRPMIDQDQQKLTGSEKKYNDVSNATNATLVRSSSLGIRSKFSKMVRVAVATIPEHKEYQPTPFNGGRDPSPDWTAA